jgi:outer membrane protein insertion porin family
MVGVCCSAVFAVPDVTVVVGRWSSRLAQVRRRRRPCVVPLLAALAMAPRVSWAAPPVEPESDPSLGDTAARRVEGPLPVDGEVVEAPTQRAVEIVALQIRGRTQVTARQVTEALEAEGLVEGEQVFWPEDPRIARAIQRLAATGYFDQVAIRLVPIEQSNRAWLIVEIHERGSLVIRQVDAAGSRLTPFAGGFDIAERNLAGSRVHLGAAFVVGTPARVVPNNRRQQAYEIYTELPVIAGTPIGVAAKAYAILANEPYRVGGEYYDPSPANFDTVPYSRFGGEFGVTIPFRADLRLGIDFRFEAIDAKLPSAGAMQVLPEGESQQIDFHLKSGLHYLSSAEFSFAWDERSRAAILGKGGHIRLDVQLSSSAIGSSYEYLRVLIGGGYSFRLPWGHWLSPSLWGGQIAGNAPRFELILPGDLSDWTPGRTMGLQYSTRWPVDTFKTGVNAFALAQIGGRVDLEYGIPLFRRPRTSFVYGGYLFFSAGVFTLTGTAAERTRRRALGELVAPVGLNANFGLKLDTSIGTFDFSVGNLLRRVPL